MTISPKADDSQSYVFQSVVSQKPPQVLKGEGIKIVVKKNGKIYEDIIDAVTGAAVGALGWGDKDIAQFMVDVLPTHTYTFPAIIGNENSEKLAKFYIDHSLKVHLHLRYGVALVPSPMKTLSKSSSSTGKKEANQRETSLSPETHHTTGTPLQLYRFLKMPEQMNSQTFCWILS